MPHLEINVGLYLQIFKDGDYYVAYSPELEISTYAKTKKRAEERFKERLEIFFDSGLSNGTLYKNLTELGWVVDKTDKIRHLTPPEKITIPTYLLKNRKWESKKIHAIV